MSNVREVEEVRTPELFARPMRATLLAPLLSVALLGCTAALAQESEQEHESLEAHATPVSAASQSQPIHGGFTLPSCVDVVAATRRRDLPAFLEANRRLAVQHGRLEEGSTGEIRGSLSRDQIREVIGANNHVRDCYEDDLVLHYGQRQVSGRLMTRFIIDPSGAICHAESPGIQPEFEGIFACVARHMRSWRFPPPAGGGVVVVNYPFMLAMDDSAMR